VTSRKNISLFPQLAEVQPLQKTRASQIAALESAFRPAHAKHKAKGEAPQMNQLLTSGQSSARPQREAKANERLRFFEFNFSALRQ
jgi:hypothetical protein